MKKIHQFTSSSPRSDASLSRRNAENGDTLIEVLMTLVVLSLSVVALMIAFSTSISASVDHRSLAANDVVLRGVAESAFYQIQQQPNPLYVSCATLSPLPANYAGINYGQPANYSVTITNIEYWNGTGFATSPCAANSPQQISLQVKNNTNLTTVSVDVVVDSPAQTPATAVTVTAVSPSSLPQGATSQILTITGTGFASGVAVVFSGQGITVNTATFNSATSLTANVTIAPTASPGYSTITATNLDQSTGTSGPIFLVTSTVPGDSIHVASMAGHASGLNLGLIRLWDAQVTIEVKNSAGLDVSGVRVSGSWDNSKGFLSTSCVTRNGRCLVQDGGISLGDSNQFGGAFDFGGNNPAATYTVSNLVFTGYTYNSSANLASDVTTCNSAPSGSCTVKRPF